MFAPGVKLVIQHTSLFFMFNRGLCCDGVCRGGFLLAAGLEVV